MTTAELKREARKSGIPWDCVASLGEEIRAVRVSVIEPEREVRRIAWSEMRPAPSHPFWRHGFNVDYRRAFAEGDRTQIPGFDVLADGLAYTFPWLRSENDPAEMLFEILKRPCPHLPKLADCRREALDRLKVEMEMADEFEAVSFSFGANAVFT